ncbi:MAG: cytochrome c biogenesis protein CcsA [Chloroflexi bacterium]|nr:cytochrome c biogenesis protein CcsA [Chloroflexota bacterium]
MSKVKTNSWQLLITMTALSITISLYLIFLYVPSERIMGIVQRIFYFHVPSAWVGFLAFFVAFLCGIRYLARREARWDAVENASIEIGVLFSTIVLVSGSIWARPVWNTWWTWDPRLTTTLVMWLYYVASLLLRQMVEDKERKARFSAVLSIAGFINVPVVFLAIRLWRTIHPVLFTTEGAAIEPSMLLTLLSSLLSFTLLYLCLLLIRVGLASLEDELNNLKLLSTLHSPEGVE